MWTSCGEAASAPQPASSGQPQTGHSGGHFPGCGAGVVDFKGKTSEYLEK